MPKVRFTAKPGLPATRGGKQWLHTKGGRKYADDGKTYRLVEPVYFESGKSYDVSASEAQWLLNCGPDDCFSIVESKPKKKAAVEPPQDPKEPDE